MHMGGYTYLLPHTAAHGLLLPVSRVLFSPWDLPVPLILFPCAPCEGTLHV